MPEERQEREFSRVSQISFSSIYRCPSTKCFILWVRLMMIFIVYNKYIQDWTIIIRVDAECANASRIDFTLYALRFLHKSQKSLCSHAEGCCRRTAIESLDGFTLRFFSLFLLLVAPLQFMLSSLSVYQRESN